MAKINERLKEMKGYDLIVIDGQNMCFKYFYGMRNLKNKKGVETGIYHGFLSLLMRMRKNNLTARIVIVWEGGQLVRKKMMSSYKDNRPKVKDSMVESCANLKKILGMMGVEQKYSPGYEADDVALALVKAESGKVLLVSSDDDWLQMMRPGVFVVRKSKEVSYDKLRLSKGFPPEKIMLYNVLRGKAANNVKGVNRLPEKLAVEILNKVESIDDLFKRKLIDQAHKNEKWVDDIKALEDNIREVYSIICLNGDIKLEDLPCEKKNMQKAKKLMVELELFQVLKTLKAIRRTSKNLRK